MSQHDMNLANQAGAPFRADLNSALQAIATGNSGTSRPATVFAGQRWIKTDYAANTWGVYVYDGAADILIGTINTSTDAYQAADADKLDGQHGAYYDDTPNGTKALFYQASAPTGWTQDTSVNDRMLRVVSGSGGGTGGSWTISGLNVLGHTLSLSQIPSHNHGGGNHSHNAAASTGNTSNPVDTAPREVRDPNYAIGTTSSGTIISTQGGGGSHDHGISHNGNWRPSYADVIVCTRSK